jgi:cobalt-zinc-cadmium efflux system protein
VGHDHDHGDVANADQRYLMLALAIIAAFMGVEVVVGLLANSLALLADAAHMLTDAASIALALVAARLAARPATPSFTFGFKRAEVMSAQINGASLLILAAFLAYEGIERLGDPPDVQGGFVIGVGVLGAVVNVSAAAVLARAQRKSLNVEGARAHVLADLYASIAAVIGGLAVVLTGIARFDALAALVVVVLMLRSGWSLLRDSSRVLLEGSPEGIDTRAVGEAMLRHPGVREVHDLHLWEVTTGFPALAAHVLVGRDDDCHLCRRGLERLLHDRFDIEHTTLQVDHEGGELLSIDAPDHGDADLRTRAPRWR